MQEFKLIKINIFLIIRILAFFAVVFCCNDLKAQYSPYNNIENSIDINGIIPDSLNHLKVEYTLSHYNQIEKKYIDVKHETIIDPHKSALVIIDIWEDKFLDSMTINFINPLINELSRLGMKIIYAPSQNEQNKNLLIIDKGIIFYNHDIMDEYLFDHEIENLFYVGFDSYYCVLDKPNGIFSYRLRDYDKNMKIFLFEEGVTSSTKEMKETTISLLKKIILAS